MDTNTAPTPHSQLVQAYRMVAEHLDKCTGYRESARHFEVALAYRKAATLCAAMADEMEAHDDEGVAR